MIPGTWYSFKLIKQRHTLPRNHPPTAHVPHIISYLHADLAEALVDLTHLGLVVVHPPENLHNKNIAPTQSKINTRTNEKNASYTAWQRVLKLKLKRQKHVYVTHNTRVPKNMVCLSVFNRNKPYSLGQGSVYIRT